MLRIFIGLTPPVWVICGGNADLQIIIFNLSIFYVLWNCLSRVSTTLNIRPLLLFCKTIFYELLSKVHLLVLIITKELHVQFWFRYLMYSYTYKV